jgi:hypothetical protein
VIEVFTHPDTNPFFRVLGLVVRLRAELTIAAVLVTARFSAWPRLEQ